MSFVLLQADLPGGYGVALVQTLLALAGVCVLAWVVLRWLAQRGLGTWGRGARVKVIERVPLDARRTLWLVKVGGKVLLIGAGDGASPTTLTELRAEDVPDEGEPKSATFVEVLRRAAAGASPPAAESEAKAVAPRVDEAERAE